MYLIPPTHRPHTHTHTPHRPHSSDYGSLSQDKLIRKRGVRKNRRDKMKLSRSLDDMDKVGTKGLITKS